MPVMCTIGTNNTYTVYDRPAMSLNCDITLQPHTNGTHHRQSSHPGLLIMCKLIAITQHYGNLRAIFGIDAFCAGAQCAGINVGDFMLSL